MVLQFFCPVCKEEYSANDELYSTRCGHVSHNRCLRDWLSSSQSCPCCLAPSSIEEIFKVFITCQSLESEEDIEENIKLKSELEQSIKNCSVVQEQLDESEKNFMELHLQFHVVENARVDLLHEKQLQHVIAESMENELEAKKQYNVALKNNLEAANRNIKTFRQASGRDSAVLPNDVALVNFDAIPELVTKDKIIESLKNQLAQKNLELEKEIRNSAVLMSEKMMLLQQVNSKKALAPTQQYAPPPTQQYAPPPTQQYAPLPTHQYAPPPTQQYAPPHIQPRAPPPNQLRAPLIQLRAPLIQLRAPPPTNFPPAQGTAAGYADFTNAEVSHQERNIREISNTNSDCRWQKKPPAANGTSQRMDRQVFLLFQYAKKLYKFGFKYVFAENNAVFVKSHDVCTPVKIVSREHVDELISKFLSFSKHCGFE